MSGAGGQRLVLVTGGAGFIGSHLCERLLRAGERVLCLDDLSSGQWAHVRRLQAFESFFFCQHDVARPLQGSAVPAALLQAVGQVYHLACPASPVHYQREPVRTTRTCVLGTLQVLELAQRNAARVLLASTSEVYGDPAVHPQPESYWGHVNPVGPRACYDEGKRCAESLCFDFWRSHGVQIKVARIFNTYGPHMHPQDGRVVSNFIVQALGGQALTLYGSGEQTRSLCYVDDLVDALLAFMHSPAQLRGPLNLGNPQECSMLELAHTVRALTGSRSPIVHLPLPADDPRRRRPDIALARAQLGWSPRVGLREGLQATIAHLRAVLR